VVTQSQTVIKESKCKDWRSKQAGCESKLCVVASTHSFVDCAIVCVWCSFYGRGLEPHPGCDNQHTPLDMHSFVPRSQLEATHTKARTRQINLVSVPQFQRAKLLLLTAAEGRLCHSVWISNPHRGWVVSLWFDAGLVLNLRDREEVPRRYRQ
jgi:hypothetical protein